jgi:hypothetical protein
VDDLFALLLFLRRVDDQNVWRNQFVLPFEARQPGAG